MAKKNGRRRSPEEAARREKIRELLEMAGVSGMDDIQQLFRETIAEFMENGLDSELDEHLGYDRYDTKEKTTDDSRNGHSSKTLRTSFGDTKLTIDILTSCIICMGQESPGFIVDIYKDAVFDTNKNGLSRYRSAGKGQK